MRVRTDSRLGSEGFNTPVAMFVFNRPDHTARLLARLAEIRPRTLLVVADGPREGNAADARNCAKVRELIDRIPWECQQIRELAPANLGCRDRVASGLSWVFSGVEEAIILEDDCLPDPSFFRFCEELLARYRDDERVMMISGDNFLPGALAGRESYYFSRYAHIWGWASWRRAWRHYDVGITEWARLRETDWLLRAVEGNRSAERFWARCFDLAHEGAVDTWDYQWVFACFARRGLSAMPRTNLVSNIGFDEHATHTRAESVWSNLRAVPLRFPLTHPSLVEANAAMDRATEAKVFGSPPDDYVQGGRWLRRVRSFAHAVRARLAS